MAYLSENPIIDLDPQIRDDPADLVAGLINSDQRFIPSRYSYSDLGSILYEQLCEQPEYYLTRTERALIASNCENIAGYLSGYHLIELGAGNSNKTAILISSLQRKGADWYYLPVDVNRFILEKGRASLEAKYPTVRVRSVLGTYDQALQWIAKPRGFFGDSPVCVLLLGSTFGNFDSQERVRFLASVHASLRPGERFVFTSDLDKSSDILLAAYNDRAGILAQMELGALRNINGLYDGDFLPENFVHRSIYNAADFQIESHLWNTVAHTVTIRSLGVSFSLPPQSSIRTDIMRKPRRTALEHELVAAGFDISAYWIEEEQCYAIYMCTKR